MPIELSHIRCIIFDCDGTLVDSELLCSMALEQQFQRYGIAYPAETMVQRYRGVKLTQIMDEMARNHETSLDADFEHAYRTRLNTLFATQLSAIDGVQSMLQQITLPMCVASSGPLTKMQTTLIITGLINYFNNNLFSSYDIGVWKPEPGIFLHAAQQMGVSPEHCLVVEDSPVGVEAAHRAGMTSIHYAPHGEASKLADEVIINMSQLTALLDSR